jgi:hypothetical protein
MVGAEVGQIGGVVDRGKGGVGGEVVDGTEVDGFDVSRVAALGADAGAISEDVADVAPQIRATRFIAAQEG